MAPKRRSPINLDLGARAEAKLEVQAQVPERSMGRLVDALTDLFRPFSEARGLRADQIRLQREDVAIAIAKKARQRLALENADTHAVPNKILVPLIEAASNEDLDDTYMIDMWASLLASAATNVRVEPRFVGILRELRGKQAQVFECLALNQSDAFDRPMAHLEDAPVFLEPASLRQRIGDFFRKRRTLPDVADIYSTIVDWLDRPGATIIDVIIHLDEDTWSGVEGLQPTPDLEFDLEILASLGLCRRVNEFYRSKFGHEIQFIYYQITELGVRFFFASRRDAHESDAARRTG